MAIQLEFTPDEVGRKRYELCTQAFILTPRTPKVSEYADVVGAMQALKKIGVPSDTVVGGQHVTLYDLQDEGGTISLERSEWHLLTQWVKEPMWRAVVLEAVIDCQEWLDGYDPSKKKTHSALVESDG